MPKDFISKWLSWIGVGVSVFYIGLIAYVISPNWGKFQTMELNNLGDFLGGTFGPLAFLWLVLGYFQQGAELRQNSAALRLQAQELKTATKHAADLVDVARKEYALAVEQRNDALEKLQKSEERAHAQAAAHERQRRQPRFRFTPEYPFENATSSRVKGLNIGHRCTHVSIKIEAKKSMGMHPVELEVLEAQATFDFTVVYHQRTSGTAPLTVSYLDSMGEQHILEFIASKDGDELTIAPAPN